MCNFHVLNHFHLIYICKLHLDLADFCSTDELLMDRRLAELSLQKALAEADNKVGDSNSTQTLTQPVTT